MPAHEPDVATGTTSPIPDQFTFALWQANEVLLNDLDALGRQWSIFSVSGRDAPTGPAREWLGDLALDVQAHHGRLIAAGYRVHRFTTPFEQDPARYLCDLAVFMEKISHSLKTMATFGWGDENPHPAPALNG